MTVSKDPAIIRFHQAAELTDEARRLFREQVRRECPELSEDLLERECLRRIYREEPTIIELLNRVPTR